MIICCRDLVVVTLHGMLVGQNGSAAGMSAGIGIVNNWKGMKGALGTRYVPWEPCSGIQTELQKGVQE
jgi:hypothetical protein